jgi:hypothetical protein
LVRLVAIERVAQTLAWEDDVALLVIFQAFQQSVLEDVT